MKISIVMSCFNRLPQLLFTLKTISKSSTKGIEIIVIDDASDCDHSLSQEIFDIYDLDIKLVKISPDKKKWINPCKAFNMGFKNSTGDIIIIQNPECCHVGDVVSHVSQQISEKNYLTYSCYYADKKTTEKLHLGSVDDIRDALEPFSVNADNSSLTWYNHPIYRPVNYHFLSAITKNNLCKLGGFDEKYSNGVGFDDDDFLLRIKRILKLNIVSFDEKSPFAAHQYHVNFFEQKLGKEEIQKKFEINRLIYESFLNKI